MVLYIVTSVFYRLYYYLFLLFIFWEVVGWTNGWTSVDIYIDIWTDLFKVHGYDILLCIFLLEGNDALIVNGSMKWNKQFIAFSNVELSILTVSCEQICFPDNNCLGTYIPNYMVSYPRKLTFIIAMRISNLIMFSSFSTFNRKYQ